MWERWGWPFSLLSSKIIWIYQKCHSCSLKDLLGYCNCLFFQLISSFDFFWFDGSKVFGIECDLTHLCYWFDLILSNKFWRSNLNLTDFWGRRIYFLFCRHLIGRKCLAFRYSLQDWRLFISNWLIWRLIQEFYALR